MITIFPKNREPPTITVTYKKFNGAYGEVTLSTSHILMELK